MGGEGSSDAVVCPKPRWLGRRRRREACSNEIEGFDSGATADVLDKFLSKGSDWEDNQAAAEASHFFGSPNRRSSNPIIHDACFGDGRLLAPLHPPSLPSNLMPSLGQPLSPLCAQFTHTQQKWLPTCCPEDRGFRLPQERL